MSFWGRVWWWLEPGIAGTASCRMSPEDYRKSLNPPIPSYEEWQSGERYTYNVDHVDQAIRAAQRPMYQEDPPPWPDRDSIPWWRRLAAKIRCWIRKVRR